ncbi:zinc-dependent metalloprotease [Sphingobacterium sp. SGL-16]|uniref:zinc-dependent metalloprotease n=1 Tax=Sphingobacterium sp. SGL-16 TaxID=2710883 RepID=UPI0013E9AF25|nr:zinc-dependent metalloprotease [Sphingobacterium sp. SGL-16]NGM72518.1 zinc-dependent metalloprotease [Sphingobacterium sp. SGL-16]
MKLLARSTFKVLPFLLLAPAIHSCNFIQYVGLYKGKETKTSVTDTVKVDTTNRSYLKVYEKAVVDSGMFQVIKKGKDFYFDIPVALMGKDFLLINKISSVPIELNEAGVNKGINSDNKVIRFFIQKDRSEVWVSEVKPTVESTPGSAIAQSVAANFTSSFIENFKIEGYSKDSSSVLININKVFDGKANSFNDVFKDLGLGTSPNTNLSVIEQIKSFDANVVVKSVLTTRVTEGNSSVPVSIGVTSNIYKLPEQAMKPRFADPRIGYFTIPRWYFSDEQQELEKRELITRWKLEPKAEDVQRYLQGELVEPVQPIVFYIDPATPKQWRQEIINGVHDWQLAFEAAGFKNAIIAKEVPDSLDFDIDDAQYSSIAYIASPKVNAMGPSVVDPRSGQILEADVIWWHNVMTALNSWMRIQTGIVDSTVRGNVFDQEKMAHAIRFVSSHEIGHTLGLMHNMGSSFSFPVDSLRSPAFTEKMGGTATSIMDYARFNYITQPGDGVKLLTPKIGLYDKYAIAWGYRWFPETTPWAELPKLRAEIEKHQHDPHYWYGEQQDSRNVIDPRAQSEDLGDNAMLAGEYGIRNLKRMMPQIINWTTEKGESYYKAGRLYWGVIGQWYTYAEHVANNIGGLYLENPVLGDNKNAYTPVPRATQIEAFDFMKNQALEMPEWLFDKALLTKTFALKDSPMGPYEQAPNSLKREFQSALMHLMLSDERLLRMTEAELLFGKAKTWTVTEYLEAFRKEVFKKTLPGANLDINSRMLQQNYVDILLVSNNKTMDRLYTRKLSLVDQILAETRLDLCGIHGVNHAKKEPDDISFRNMRVDGMARTSDMLIAKRAELMAVLDILKKAKGGDHLTKSHYQDLILRIEYTINKK